MLDNDVDDPDELLNLGDDRSQIDRATKFAEEVSDRGDLTAIKPFVRQNQQQRKLVSTALAKGQGENWDYKPKSDYYKSYIRDHGGAALTDRKVRVVAKGYRLPGE